MKKFKDLKVGDTVYKAIYAFNSNTPLKVKKEKVAVIEKVHSGSVIKTEDIIEDDTFQDTYTYFVDSRWYNAECTETNNTEIWWDKFALQELINNCAAEYQRKISEMLDVLKD